MQTKRKYINLALRNHLAPLSKAQSEARRQGSSILVPKMCLGCENTTPGAGEGIQMTPPLSRGQEGREAGEGEGEEWQAGQATWSYPTNGKRLSSGG